MSVKLCHRSGEILGKLQRALRLPERPPLIRLALAHGLLAVREKGLPHEDSRGPEIPLKVINPGPDFLIDALIAQQLETPFDPADRKRLYKALVDLGLSVMFEKFEELESPTDFLVEMARQGVAS
jgi:hypothetical protein